MLVSIIVVQCQHPSDVAGDGEIDKEIQVEERNPEEGKRVLIGEKTSLTWQSTSPGRSEKEPRTQTQTVSGQVCTLTTMFHCFLPLQLGEDGTQ